MSINQTKKLNTKWQSRPVFHPTHTSDNPCITLQQRSKTKIWVSPKNGTYTFTSAYICTPNKIGLTSTMAKLQNFFGMNLTPYTSKNTASELYCFRNMMSSMRQRGTSPCHWQPLTITTWNFIIKFSHLFALLSLTTVWNLITFNNGIACLAASTGTTLWHVNEGHREQQTLMPTLCPILLTCHKLASVVETKHAILLCMRHGGNGMPWNRCQRLSMAMRISMLPHRPQHMLLLVQSSCQRRRRRLVAFSNRTGRACRVFWPTAPAFRLLAVTTRHQYASISM